VSDTQQVRSDAYDRWGWISQAVVEHPVVTRDDPDRGTYHRERTVGVRWGRLSLNYLIAMALAGLAAGILRLRRRFAPSTTKK